MALRIAAGLAWALGVLASLPSLGPLSVFNQLAFAERATAVWLFCAGSALIIAGRGLHHGGRYAAWLAVIVCGFWLPFATAAFLRLLIGGGTWSRTTWIILALQWLWCVAILGIVLAHSAAFQSRPDSEHVSSSSDAA